MARDFTKNTSNYMDIGINQIAPILDGASFLCVHAWVNADTYTTGANDNRVFSTVLDDAKTGFTLMVNDAGATETPKVGARSQSADVFQTQTGTTDINSGSWVSAGGRADIAGDKIAVFTNGNKDTDASVTFGASTYTNSVPTTSDDVIGGSSIPATVTPPQFDGDIAEVAVFAKDIGDNAFIGLAHGVNPFPFGYAVYFSLYGNDSPENDLSVNHETGTITGTVSQTPHAPVELLENYL